MISEHNLGSSTRCLDNTGRSISGCLDFIVKVLRQAPATVFSALPHGTQDDFCRQVVRWRKKEMFDVLQQLHWGYRNLGESIRAVENIVKGGM